MRCSCFVSPSPPSPAPPLAAVAATARWPPASTLPILPVGRRQHQHCPLQLRRPAETTALGRRGLAVVRAQNHRSVQPPPVHPNHFVEEMELISKRFMQTFCTFEGSLYKEAIEMSAHVCYSAEKAVTMASQVEDSARLSMCTYNTTAPHPEGVISADTMHLTLKAYVDIFVHIAEDSYNRRVSIETVTSFLDALRGLVSISHILLDDALEAISWTHPRESLAEYAFNYDVKSMRREFDWEMAHLEDAITKSTFSNSCKMVLPTILKGVEATKSLLGLMAVRRQRALGKAKK